jgi:glutamate--cysteine ligase
MAGGQSASGARLAAHRARFLEHVRCGARPRAAWRCGVELELFGYEAQNLARIDAAQVQSVLASFATSQQGRIFEGPTLIEANAGPAGRLTVEPGGQIEFSGAPQPGLDEAERHLRAYLAQLGAIAAERGLIFLATGFDPVRAMGDQHWFPKMRYAAMRPYLAGRGRRAWDMMCRTCAVQVNLDYGSEVDLAKKFILGNRLAPIITAIFANSPFEEGRPSGYKSTRAAVWLETDADRTGLSPLAFVEDFSLDDFVAYTLNVPIMFARRNGQYVRMPPGLKFADFLRGGGSGLHPVFDDWTDHLTTIFTEARLKQYLELRSADCVGLEMALALQALWKGLMYDPATLEDALRLAPRLGPSGARALQEQVARVGLAARYAQVDVLGLAKDLVALAGRGLQRVAPAETLYLDILREQVIEDEVCPADILLRNWHGSWHGRLDKVIEYLRLA